jgi:hypothetical protein
MSERLRELAHRKQLLVARSRLHRLQIQHAAQSLGDSLSPARAIRSFARSDALRPVIFTALLFAFGRTRLGRVVRGAMAVLAALRAAQGFAAKD